MSSFFSFGNKAKPTKSTSDDSSEASTAHKAYPTKATVSTLRGNQNNGSVEESIFEDDSHGGRDIDASAFSRIAESSIAETRTERTRTLIRVISIATSSSGYDPAKVKRCKLAFRIGTNGIAHATVLTDQKDDESVHASMHLPPDKGWPTPSEKSQIRLFQTMDLDCFLDGCYRNLEYVVFDKGQAFLPPLWARLESSSRESLEQFLRQMLKVTFEETAKLINSEGVTRGCKSTDGLVAHLLRQCGCGALGLDRQPQALRVEYGEPISVEFSWRW